MEDDYALEAAIEVARLGECERARGLFQAIIDQDPRNFRAWLWLSELAGTLEDQTAALEQAQAYCPVNADGRRDLQVHLNSLRGAIPLGAPPSPEPGPPAAMEQSLPERGKRAPDEAFFQAERLTILGKQAEAVDMLARLAETTPQDERIWMLLSELHTDPAEKYRLLEKVLKIDPGHAEAAGQIEALRPIIGNPLRTGLYFEKCGEYDQAIKLYRSLAAKSTSVFERLEANRRIAKIKILQEGDLRGLFRR